MAKRNKTDWRTKGERERDLVDMASLYLLGKKQIEIASEISSRYKKALTQQTISKDIKTIRDRWLMSSLVDFNEKIAEEIAKVDHRERQAMDAWEKSKEPLQKIYKKTLKSDSGGKGKLVEERTVVTERVGDPRYLMISLSCIERRCKLLDLDGPIKHEHRIDAKGSAGELEHKRRAERIASFLLAANTGTN